VSRKRAIEIRHVTNPNDTASRLRTYVHIASYKNFTSCLNGGQIALPIVAITPLNSSYRAMVSESSSAERAAFAVTARLLSCLVTESLVRAIFVPCRWPDCVGIGVILKASISAIPAHDCKYYSQGDVLAIIPLINVPVIKSDSNDPRGKEIGLLDPFDIFPLVLATPGDSDVHGKEVWLRACMRFQLTLSIAFFPAALQ